MLGGTYKFFEDFDSDHEVAVGKKILLFGEGISRGSLWSTELSLDFF
jgi:hypothetical protein